MNQFQNAQIFVNHMVYTIKHIFELTNYMFEMAEAIQCELEEDALHLKDELIEFGEQKVLKQFLKNIIYYKNN